MPNRAAPQSGGASFLFSPKKCGAHTHSMVSGCDVGRTSAAWPPAAVVVAAVVDDDDGDYCLESEGADDNCDATDEGQVDNHSLWAEPVAGLLHSASALRCAGN